MAVQDTIEILGNFPPFRRTFRALRILWLFPANDLKIIVLPSLLYAFSFAYPILSHKLQSSSISPLLFLLSRLPFVVLWTWVNLLSFTIGNQRQPDAIEEDKLNKPWRPIARGYLSAEDALVLDFYVKLATIAVAVLIHSGLYPTVILMTLFIINNELKGGDLHWISRNLLNALGIPTFAFGALQVTLNGTIPIKDILPWTLMIALTIATTIHMQDLYDQRGDKASGRSTIPLVFGDMNARWSLAVPIVLWSLACPAYWKSSHTPFALPLAIAATIVWRMLTKKAEEQDKTTYKFYCLWLMSLYTLPLFKTAVTAQIA